MQTDRWPLTGFGWVLGAIFAAVISLGGFVNAQERNVDPSDIWYTAFQLILEGEAAEKKGRLLEALNKYGESKPLFDGLSRQYPNFYPELVRFRREGLVESITRLRERMRNPAAPIASAEPRPDPGIVSSGSLTPDSPEFMAQGVPQNPAADLSTVPGGTPDYSAAAVTPGGVSLPEPWQPRQTQPQPPPALPGGSRMPDAVVRPPGSASDPAGQDLGQIHQSRVQWMQGEIDRLNARNRSLEGDLAQRQRYLERVQSDLAKAQQEAAERSRQLASAQQDPNLKAQAVELERLLNEALQELDRSQQQNKAVFAELRKTQQELDALRKEKDAVEKERDELIAIVDGGESAAAIQGLMQENRRLRQKLTQAEATAKRLGEESHDKGVEIALLKEQIQRIDSERKQLLEENRRYDAHIAGLQKRLRALGQELSPEEMEKLASESPSLVKENELLKTIVLKQLRRQTQIQQTKSLLLDGLDKLGNDAADLYAMVEDLATGPAISPEERKMIRQPGVEELVAASAVEQVNATIIVEGQEPNGGGEGILEVQKIDEELLQIQKAAQLDFRDGRYAEAEESYLKFLRYRPRSVICLCNLALVKLATKKYDEAESLLEKAIAFEDDNGRAYYLLGRTHFAQGRFDDALSRLNEGLRHDPKNAKAHNCVGVISSQKGFANRAEEAFTQAVTIDPKYGDAHFNLAVLYATGDNPNADKALDHYRKARRLGVPQDTAIESFLNDALLTASVN